MPDPQRIAVYPTGGRTPVDGPEARRITDEYLCPPAQVPPGFEMVVEEFEDCFAVFQARPLAPEQEENPQIEPGDAGGVIAVLDKQTAEVSYWPNGSTDGAVELYLEAKAAGQVEHRTEADRV